MKLQTCMRCLVLTCGALQLDHVARIIELGTLNAESRAALMCMLCATARKSGHIEMEWLESQYEQNCHMNHIQPPIAPIVKLSASCPDSMTGGQPSCLQVSSPWSLAATSSSALETSLSHFRLGIEKTPLQIYKGCTVLHETLTEYLPASHTLLYSILHISRVLFYQNHPMQLCATFRFSVTPSDAFAAEAGSYSLGGFAALDWVSGGQQAVSSSWPPAGFAALHWFPSAPAPAPRGRETKGEYEIKYK